MDILSTFLYYFLKTGRTNFLDIFKFIATGLFGKAALEGGSGMILTGLILHYAIACIFTLLFFRIFPRIQMMTNNRALIAVLFGIFTWCVMNLLVVPVSRVPHRNFNLLNAAINIGILIICIGVPLTWIATARDNRVE